MRFYKYCGAGNDFVLLEDFEERLADDSLPELARRLCHRHFGVGADGLMVLRPSPEAHCAMLFFNADGTLAEMCGNGARCLCRHLHDRGLAGQRQRVMSTAGLVTGQRMGPEQYRIRLNPPSLLRLQISAAGQLCDYVELGEPGIPHAVVRADLSLPRPQLTRLALELRHAPQFPRGANVNLWQPRQDGDLELLTFERGVEDFTLACGTGTGATVYALAQRGLLRGPGTRVHMAGGLLTVELPEEGEIFLTGPAQRLFQGDWEG